MKSRPLLSILFHRRMFTREKMGIHVSVPVSNWGGSHISAHDVLKRIFVSVGAFKALSIPTWDSIQLVPLIPFNLFHIFGIEIYRANFESMVNYWVIKPRHWSHWFPKWNFLKISENLRLWVFRKINGRI